MTVSPARRVATQVLHRVADKGAYASHALDAELDRAGVRGRDAALATEIVYGALRVLPTLDSAIEGRLQRGGQRLDPWIRAVLRVAAYQLLFLSRVPGHAAVNDAVSLAREQRGNRVGGFVNAVLRKVGADRPAEPNTPTALVVPAWLERTLEQNLGPDRVRAFLETRSLPPPVCLRVRDAADRDALAADIGVACPDAKVTAATLAPGALWVQGGGDPRRLPGYEEGRFTVQEEGAQLVAWLAGVRPGERVLDACAGHGGKTLLFAEQVGDGGHVDAADLHERKLAAIAEGCRRLGVPAGRVSTHPLDLTVGAGGLADDYDRVVVDAPCTGLGTVHRRPELLQRLGAEDPARLADLQLAILSTVAPRLRPGGELVYAVCSLTTAEGPGVAERFEAMHPQFEPLAGPWPVPISEDRPGRLVVGPWLLPASCASGSNPGPDGFQLFRWRFSLTAG